MMMAGMQRKPGGDPMTGTDGAGGADPIGPRPLMIANGEIVIATEAFGRAGDTPVVLVMGATASMLWWPDSFCRDLARAGRFLVRYDNRDTGQSTSSAAAEPDYSVEDMAGDLLAVMDGHGVPDAHVVGMSLGGLVAQIAALRQPDRVRSLTLIASEPLGWDGEELPGIAPKFLDHFRGFAELDWTDRAAVSGFLLEIARLSAGSAVPFDPSAAMRRIDAELDRATDISRAFNHGMVQLREDWTGRARDIVQPTLIIHGSEDPILPVENARAIQASIRQARLHVLAGIGHELPEAVLPELASQIAAFTDAARSAPSRRK
jgi:pimeloyl-ACP methyl ester carboxylesterase